MPMTIFLAVVAAALAYSLTGSMFWTIAVGVGIAIWVRRKPAANAIVYVMDLKTGETKIQPDDEATRRYLSTRKDNGN